MQRFGFVGVMIGLALVSGCKTTGPEKASPKLDLARHSAVLKVSAKPFNGRNSGRPGEKIAYSYEVSVCLWKERLPGPDEDLNDSSRERAWVEESLRENPPPGYVVDVLSAPNISLPANEWRSMEAIHRVGSTTAETSFWVDGELLTVGSHPGVSLKAFVEPLEGDLVRVKGAMAAAKMSPAGTFYHAFPFDVEMTIGSTTKVYERELRLGARK